ncbi:MAG: hypothetical protein J6K39_03765 [Clostridia bacterium]|nr:hypothetical protein [Clostridia bacterium]
MKKHIYTLFLLVFVAIFCFGCGAEQADGENVETNAFRLCRTVSDSGEISMSYAFPVNSHVILESGLSEKDVKTYRFYLANYVNALAKQYKEKIVDGVKVSGCVYFEDVDGLGFTIEFESLDEQKRFFGVDSEDESGPTSSSKVSGFFVKKVEVEMDFPFSAKSAENMKSICQLAIQAWCQDGSIDASVEKGMLQALDNSLFVYDFATTDESLQAEKQYVAGDFVHSFFEKSLNEIEDGERISFWVTTPNTPLWYISALVFVGAGMVGGYFCKRKKN